MLEKEAAKAKKFGKGVITLITFLIIAAAAFQIHRLSRASLSRAVEKYAGSEGENPSTVLERSTADAPPPRGSLSDIGGPADAPAEGDAAPGGETEPNPADAPADPQ